MGRKKAHQTGRGNFPGPIIPPRERTVKTRQPFAPRAVIAHLRGACRLWKSRKRRAVCFCRTSPARGAQRFPDRRSREPPCARRVWSGWRWRQRSARAFPRNRRRRVWAANQRDATADEVGVEVAIGEGGAVGGDEQIRVREPRGVDGRKLDLHRPLGKLAGNVERAGRPRRGLKRRGAGAGQACGAAALAALTAASSYAAASRVSKEIAPVGQAGRQSPRPSQ